MYYFWSFFWLLLLPTVLLSMEDGPFEGVDFAKTNYEVLKDKFGRDLFDAKDSNGNTMLHF